MKTYYTVFGLAILKQKSYRPLSKEWFETPEAAISHEIDRLVEQERDIHETIRKLNDISQELASLKFQTSGGDSP